MTATLKVDIPRVGLTAGEQCTLIERFGTHNDVCRVEFKTGLELVLPVEYLELEKLFGDLTQDYRSLK